MRVIPLIALSMITLGAASAVAQEPNPQLETQKLSDNIYLITGPGGNIALLIGKESAYLVDDQIAAMSPALKKTIAELTPKPVRFVINTHWHGDHTGGNAVFGQQGAIIVAHDNVRKRLSSDQFNAAMKKKTPASPEVAWPVVTFADSVTLHLEGEEVAISHVDAAHTDSDALVWFKHANIIHTGDIFISNGYPFIDMSTGGTVDGLLRANDRVLAMAQPSTRIIPGHGGMSDRGHVKAFRDMVALIRDRVKALIKQGKSLDAIQAAKPTAEFDAAWGKAFINGHQFVEAVFTDLTRSR